MNMRKFTKEDMRRLVAMWNGGASAEKIGEALGLPVTEVRGRLRRYRREGGAVVVRSPGEGRAITADEEAAMLDLLRNGATIAEVADASGRSETSVQRVCDENNIPWRRRMPAEYSPRVPITPEITAKITGWRRVGAEVPAIASTIGISSAGVYRVLRENPVQVEKDPDGDFTADIWLFAEPEGPVDIERLEAEIECAAQAGWSEDEIARWVEQDVGGDDADRWVASVEFLRDPLCDGANVSVLIGHVDVPMTSAA